MMLVAMGAFVQQGTMIAVSQAMASGGFMPQPATMLSGPVHFHDNLAVNMHARAMAASEGVRDHDKATTWLACLCGNEGFDVRHVVNGCDNRLRAEGGSGGFEWVQITFDKRRRWR